MILLIQKSVESVPGSRMTMTKVPKHLDEESTQKPEGQKCFFQMCYEHVKRSSEIITALMSFKYCVVQELSPGPFHWMRAYKAYGVKMIK
jgi:hypothetical protein